MTEPTRGFFADAPRAASADAPAAVDRLVRFDVADGERTEHWYLHIRKGDVTVSHDDGDGRLRGQRRHRPRSRRS